MCEVINISVVVPLYNKEQSVVKTMECILAQTFSPIEVLIINDGSTDNSASVVEDFIFRNNLQKTWSLIRKPNGGVSSARNRGIQEAKGDYIAFLDADDYWEPNYLQEQSRMIQDFPDAALWSVGWGYLEGEKKTPLVHYPNNYRGYIENYWTLKKGTNIFFLCVCVFRRNVLLELHGYDERIKYGEDLDVAYRIILNYPVAFNNVILGYYRQDAENRACATLYVRWEDRLECYMDKYKTYRKENTDFCRFIDKGTANVAAYYLFEENNRNVIPVVRQLNFSVIPFYYSLYFHAPFWMGKMCYMCIMALKKIYAGVMELTNFEEGVTFAVVPFKITKRPIL